MDLSLQNLGPDIRFKSKLSQALPSFVVLVYPKQAKELLKVNRLTGLSGYDFRYKFLGHNFSKIMKRSKQETKLLQNNSIE